MIHPLDRLHLKNDLSGPAPRCRATIDLFSPPPTSNLNRRQPMRSDIVDLELMIHQQTPAAVLVSDDGDRNRAVWLPKKRVEFDEKRELGKAQIVSMPEDLAIEKGLV